MIGTTIGPYRILEALGAGGMGEVYRARDTRLNRDVALKILPSSMTADEDRLRRFTLEAQSAGGLNHPNILTIYDIGPKEGQPYLAAELLEGEVLRQKLDAGTLPRSKAIDYARQAATGLAAAHAKGITHRDIKPENLFVTTDGRLKILDFGLAKAAPPESSAATADDATRLEQVTSAGMVLGTAGYMSPEQVRAQPVDSRSDIFSLGVVLYEMLAGRRPFSGDSMVETMNAILTADPPELAPPGSTDRAVPPALAQVVHHCLEKNPEERFQSARDLAFALAALSTSSGTSTTSGTAAAAGLGTSTGSRPGRGVLPLVTGSLAMVAVLLAVMLYSQPAPGVDLSQYRFRPVATDPEVESSPAWSPDGRTIAYTKEIDGTNQLFIRELGVDDAVQLTHVSSSVTSLFWWPDSSRLGFVVRGRPLTVSRVGGEPEPLLADGLFDGAGGAVLEATLTPDGQTLALWATEDNRTVGLYLASPIDAAPVQHLPDRFTQPCCATPLYLRFSPDSRTLLVAVFDLGPAGGPAIWQVPVPDGEPTRVFEGATAGQVPSWSWLPDGRRLVAGFRAAHAPVPGLWLADLDTGTLTPIAVGLSGQDLPSVSPDGASVAFVAGGPDHDLIEIPLDPTQPLAEVLASSRDEFSGAWLPDDDRFAYVTDRNGEQELRVRSRRDDTDRLVVAQSGLENAGTEPLIGAPAASPDGRRVAYHAIGSNGTGAVWISPIGGGTPTQLFEEPVLQVSPSWSADGQHIALWRLGAGLAVVQVGRGAAPTVIAPDADPTPMPVWSPTGEWIAYVDDTLKLVSPDGTQHRDLASPARVGLAWSRDGATIYTIAGRALLAVDVASGRARTLRTLDAALTFDTPSNPGQRLTLSPDGRSLLVTTVRTRTDIWILEGFR